MDNLGGSLIILIYFLPTFLALRLRKRNTLAIFAMNLLLGWTFVGWVVALVWVYNQNQTVITKNEIKTDSKIVTIDKSLDEQHIEKIDYTNNTETSTADKSNIGIIKNNSNRKKILNILLFSSFLWGTIGFSVYYNENQSRNTSIVSNQSNSTNSTIVSNANEIERCGNYLKSQNYQLALQAGKYAVRMYPQSAEAHTCLGGAYYYIGHFNLSIKELKIAEKLANDKADLGVIYSAIGSCYKNLGDSNNALLYYDKQLEIARDLNNKEEESKALNNIAGIYQDKNNLDKALEYYNKSLQLTSKPSIIGTSYNNIATLYTAEGNYNKAVEYYKKAIESAQKAGDYHDTAIYMLNLGTIYEYLKNFAESKNYFQKGLLIIQKFDDKYWVDNKYWEAIAYGKLGGLYSLRSSYAAQHQGGGAVEEEYYTKSDEYDTKSRHLLGLILDNNKPSLSFFDKIPPEKDVFCPQTLFREGLGFQPVKAKINFSGKGHLNSPP